LLVDERRNELNMIFHFDVVRLDRGEGWRWKPWTLPDLKAIYSRFDRELDIHCWQTVFLSNHDNPRAVSHFGDDSPEFRVPSAKLLATMLLTLKGTPFIYQGDELGMTNYPFRKIEEFDDIEVRNAWRAEVVTKQVDPEEFLAHMLKTSRDHSRTPMQWNDSEDAGFTNARRPWLAVNPNYREVNARRAQTDPDSVYNYFRQIISLRKRALALVYGDYHDLDPINPTIFSYTRTLGPDRYLIVLNFSRDEIAYTFPEDLKAKQLLLSNRKTSEENTTLANLRGWEARVYQAQ
jgi:oligo-1,6-glucosidase